jgi:DNA-binding NtrC family response regulator
MLAQAEEPAPLLVGQSPRIRNVLRMVDKLGHCRWPVLLLGETGTGKEVVARSIHKVQPVGPFVTIDCSSLVGPLMESELFGHVKGAFTGAVTPKTGLIEVANGGTAFFDEIGELPLDLQAKLLRVLQEKEFRPVGSLTHRRSDFRVIAATNRDLAKEVEKGAFRRDLFYRLNVVNLRLAPLRDRKEDIPSLIAHFLARHARGHILTQETLEAMLSYDWPGNVRELENMVERLAILCEGSTIDTPMLPENLVASARPATPPIKVKLGDNGLNLNNLVRELEGRLINDALKQTGGNKQAAARLLGLKRTTFSAKLRRCGVIAPASLDDSGEA